MSTNAATSLTLLDLTRRLDPDGSVAAVAEVLDATNEALADMPFVEGNQGFGHKSTIRTGIPEGTWRQLNYGVVQQKSTTMQITDSTGMLENYAEVDKALVNMNGNSNEFRMSEDKAFIQGMNKNMARTLFYGDTKIDGEKFMGFAPRYSQKAGMEAGTSADNILLAGGAGNTNTSVWLVVWSPEKVFGIYPKGSKAGLSAQDLGEVTLEDANKGKFQGYRTHYKWDCGLVVRDWRQVVRIANIDVNLLTKNAATGADLIDLMIQALELVEDLKDGQPVFYCGRTVRSFLRRQMANKSNANLAWGELAGKKVMMFDEVPVRRVDAILSTEATVV